MHPVPGLSPYLKQLRLSGILDSLEARNRQAIDSKLAYTEFLALLIQDEVARREQKKFALRLRRAAARRSPPQLEVTICDFKFSNSDALSFLLTECFQSAIEMLSKCWRSAFLCTFSLEMPAKSPPTLQRRPAHHVRGTASRSGIEESRRTRPECLRS